MDAVASNHSKNSCKFPGILHRFARVWKSGPVGIAHGSDGNMACNAHVADCSTEKTGGGDDANGIKIHPQPLEDNLSGNGIEFTNVVIPKLFDAISSLKLAYIQFQKAHIPYDPDKIRVADEAVVSQLESISDIEHLYTEKQKYKFKRLAFLNAKVAEHQNLLEKLQSQAQAKDSEILQLKWKIEGLQAENIELKEELKKTYLPVDELFLSHQNLNSELFNFVFETTVKAIHDFGKPLIGLMKASGWDLDSATNAIDASTIYMERSHKKYVFDAFVSRRMLDGNDAIRNTSSKEDIGNVMRYRDPFDALIAKPDSKFAHFCLTRYLAVVHPKMEYSFFGNLDQSDFIKTQRHPRTPFYLAFVKMARWVWVLQVMAALIHPRATMFCIKNGCKFREDQMDSVVMLEGRDKLNVAFTVMPGFRIGNSLVRCKVYLSEAKKSIS